MSDHKHGTMDISGQEQTYAAFMGFVARICVALLLFALFLAVFAV